jgi:DNA-binding Xre family transcriptional regulator
MDIVLKDIHVGQEIKNLLFKKNMKKNEFARLIGVPQQHVNRILERDTMETKRLIKVCEALDTNIFAKFCNFPNQVTAYLSAVAMGNGDSINNIGDSALLAEVEKYKSDISTLNNTVELLKEQIETLKQLNQSKDLTISLLRNTK